MLITTGISAVGYMPVIAGLGMAGAAARNDARALNSALRDHGVFVACICLGVQIAHGDPHGDPDVLAENYYRLYENRYPAEVVINSVPDSLIEFDEHLR